jgi:hypothetical protein
MNIRFRFRVQKKIYNSKKQLILNLVNFTDYVKAEILNKINTVNLFYCCKNIKYIEKLKNIGTLNLYLNNRASLGYNINIKNYEYELKNNDKINCVNINYYENKNKCGASRKQNTYDDLESIYVNRTIITPNTIPFRTTPNGTIITPNTIPFRTTSNGNILDYFVQNSTRLNSDFELHFYNHNN